MSHLPLELESRFQHDYPGLLSALKGVDAFEQVALIASTYLKTHGVSIDDALDEVFAAFFLSRWRDNRVIYTIDDTLSTELGHQVDAIDYSDTLPADLILNLPYPCIAVQSSGIHAVLRDSSSGGVVQDMTYSGRMLVTTLPAGCFGVQHRCLAVLAEITHDAEIASGAAKPGLVYYYLPITGTLGDSLQALRDQWKIDAPDLWASANEQTTHFEALIPLFAAQIVLYLQAVNADIQRKPTSSGRPKSKTSSRNRSERPPKEYSVGIRIGRTIRAYNASSGISSPRSGSSGRTVTPHTRRGHWHHYWTGPKSDPDKRQLVLKWAHPTMVGGDASSTTTVYPVKGKKPRPADQAPRSGSGTPEA